MSTFIACKFNDNDVVGCVEIQKDKVLAYGTMAYMLTAIKEDGEYITSNFVYTLDSAPFWDNIIPALMSNDNYVYEKVQSLPKEMKSSTPVEVYL